MKVLSRLTFLKRPFWRNFHKIFVRLKWTHVHSVEKLEILSHQSFFSWNQLFSNFFSKYVTFTKFFYKKCEREFLVFPHCVTSCKNSVKSSIHWSKLVSRNISLVQCFCHLFLVYWNQFANFLHPRKLIDTLTSLYCFLPKLISLSLAIILKTVDCIFYCEMFSCKKSTLFCWQPMSRFS